MTFKKFHNNDSLGIHIEEHFKNGLTFGATDKNNCYREDYAFLIETRKQKRIRRNKNRKYKIKNKIM